MSSDDEDLADIPRRDIDLIEISSDEDETKAKSAPSQRGPRTALPVRTRSGLSVSTQRQARKLQQKYWNKRNRAASHQKMLRLSKQAGNQRTSQRM